MTGSALATEVMGRLGSDVVVEYPTPQIAGGIRFYPWIDATETYWGIVARYDLRAATPGSTPAYDSVACGGAIRHAFLGDGAP